MGRLLSVGQLEVCCCSYLRGMTGSLLLTLIKELLPHHQATISVEENTAPAKRLKRFLLLSNLPTAAST